MVVKKARGWTGGAKKNAAVLDPRKDIPVDLVDPFAGRKAGRPKIATNVIQEKPGKSSVASLIAEEIAEGKSRGSESAYFAVTTEHSKWHVAAREHAKDLFVGGIKDAVQKINANPEDTTPQIVFKMPDFDALVHVPLLFDTIGRGQLIHHFCAAAGITRRLFTHWLAELPVFATAYELAQELGLAIAIDCQISFTNVPPSYWGARFNFMKRHSSNYAKIFVAQKLDDRLKLLRQELADGSVTEGDYKVIVESFLTEVKLVAAARLDSAMTPEKIDDMNAKDLLQYLRHQGEMKI